MHQYNIPPLPFSPSHPLTHRLRFRISFSAQSFTILRGLLRQYPCRKRNSPDNVGGRGDGFCKCLVVVLGCMCGAVGGPRGADRSPKK